MNTVIIQKPIYVYQKPELGKVIPLPPEVRDNPAIVATATANVLPSPYGGVAVAFTNTTTGRSNISYQAKPTPFWEFKKEIEASAEWGVNSKGTQMIQGGIRYTPLRTGILNWHIKAEGDSSHGELKALIGAHGVIN